jgi:hypothetical protein
MFVTQQTWPVTQFADSSHRAMRPALQFTLAADWHVLASGWSQHASAGRLQRFPPQRT